MWDLKIRTTERTLIPFKPNYAQNLYVAGNDQLATFRGNREIILKARQMGFSTFIAVLMFLDTVNNPHTQSIMIAQDETNSKRIFQMIKRFVLYLDKKFNLIPTTDSAGALEWAQIDSAFYVGWAGSKKVGRGGTINNIHLSEPAFYEDAGDLVSGLLQSLPSDGNLFLESTANGVGNYFYKEFQAALNHESIYTSRFFPWTIDVRYQANTLINGGAFSPTDEELELQDKHSLSLEQLIWRRNKILELRNAQIAGDTTVGTFPQEYPLTADEAFLTSGATYFDNEYIVKTLMPSIAAPLEINIPKQFNFLANINGRGIDRITIFKRPVAGHRYIITGDPSEGLSISGEHDFCSSSVIDYDTWEQVATIHGRWEPYDFAGIVWQGAKWYNDALIVIERNNHGHSVLNTLVNHYQYPLMTTGCTGVYTHLDYDVKAKRNIAKPGFPTNVKTKVMLLNALNQVAMDNSLKINSRAHLEEMKLYSKLPGGKFGCIIGHDDRVIDLGLAAVVLTDDRFVKKMLAADKPKVSRPIVKTSFKRKVYV